MKDLRVVFVTNIILCLFMLCCVFKQKCLKYLIKLIFCCKIHTTFILAQKKNTTNDSLTSTKHFHLIHQLPILQLFSRKKKKKQLKEQKKSHSLNKSEDKEDDILYGEISVE